MSIQEPVYSLQAEQVIGVASYRALEHVLPYDFQQYIFQFTLGLHNVWRRLYAAVSPNIFIHCIISCHSICNK